MLSVRRKIKKIMLYRFLNRYPDLKLRFEALKDFAKQVRSSEYHLTNKCNIRCQGCWFFSNDLDKKTEELMDLAQIETVVQSQAQKNQTAALLIGGEPTLVPERVKIFQKHLKYITISTNGLKKLPMEGFENVAIAISVFGGGSLDDKLRAYGPTGKAFSGLFQKALDNYKNDPRVQFVYAITEKGIEHIESTVKAIRQNGNTLYFNYYVEYDKKGHSQGHPDTSRLINEALRMCEKYPDTVLSHPYFVKAMITGKTDWGEFGYESCPSLSTDYAGHERRKQNGNPILPGFNTYFADMKTVAFCCTSGSCDKCHDAHAVASWIMVSFKHFMKNKESLRAWIEMA